MVKKPFLLYGALLFGALMVLAASVLAAAYYWLVVRNPGDEISRENIERILAIESPVYYRDGVNRVGVFFEQAHRQYITFEQIPSDFVYAIVAAEDSSFFQHHGIDFAGVTRATIANLKARRVVQGGSTITQQTAKNLFKRQDRSLAAKLQELVYALRLERRYEKSDILEFYSNQFFVSGNGRGLGMAARYFFDKRVEDLDLLESAFIAGSVKGPNHYNPFIKKSEEEAQRARRLARQRTAYVLEQMRRLGFIDEERLQANLELEIPFQQGRMTYVLNTLLDLVREGMGEPEVVEALSRHGIDNVATSGVRIVTSVDKNLQDEAHFALRKELSRLDILLRGYDHRAMQELYSEMPPEGDLAERPGPFLLGRIAAVEGTARDPLIKVDFEQARAGGSAARFQEHPAAWLDRAGLFNLLTPLARHRRQPWSEASDADLARLLKELSEGDLVYVSVRERRPEGEMLLDLEKYPELQGGVLVLKEGGIRAMIGGHDNRHYNRATTARRSMGSVMKPLVYAAALQLGWNSADLLDNRRQVFLYRDQAYFPRHMPGKKYDEVSLSWAGVTSENLASVWLLYHLCDHLPPARITELAAQFGLARAEDESMAAYSRRIRDGYGIIVNRNTLYRTAFERAMAMVEPDLLFDSQDEEYQLLRTFNYGAGFDRFREEVEAEFIADKPGEQSDGLHDEFGDQFDVPTAGEERSEADIREGRDRLAMLDLNFVDYLARRDQLRELINQVDDPEFMALLPIYRNDDGTLLYTTEILAGGRLPLYSWELRQLLPEGEAARQYFWGEVLVEGKLRVATLDLLEEVVGSEYRRLASLPPYSPQVLHQLRDFRVLIALNYVVGMTRALGVESALAPVLSFPLGSNVVSLLELARAFEVLRSGRLYLNADRIDGGGLGVIDRVETSDGRLIYTQQRQNRRVFDPRVSLAISDILYNAMEHGTGRSAHNRVRLRSQDPARSELLAELDLRLPMFGKTGTANRFINAAFAGYLPGPAPDNTLTLDSGYTIAAYVGFDDNRPMVQNSNRITGGGGALPVWARVADAVFRNGGYDSSLDLADFAFGGAARVEVAYPPLNQVEIPVEAGRGVMVSRAMAQSQRSGPSRARIVTFGRFGTDGSFEPARFFQPYWYYKGED